MISLIFLKMIQGMDSWLCKKLLNNFGRILKKYSTDEDIRQAFKIEEALLELDVKLGDFAKTRIEVGNYQKKVTQVMEIIDKFKRK